MTRSLTLVAAVAVASLAAAAPAFGGARACNLVVDPKGDYQHFPDASPADDYYVSPDLDVVSADVATNKRWLTAAIRLASLRPTATDAPTGGYYEMTFRIADKTYSVHAVHAPDGKSAGVYENGVGTGTAAAVWDYAKGEVRISAPVTSFPGLAKRQPIKDIAVNAGHHYGSGGTSTGAGGWGISFGGGGTQHIIDTATTARGYVAGTASCVEVGR